MSVYRKRDTGRSFYSADQGKSFATYDLTGKAQRARDLYDVLNAGVSGLVQNLTDEARKMFNDETLTVRCSEWVLAGVGKADIQAQVFPAEHRDTGVVLATDRKSVFGLSELFFGGDPGKVTEKQLEKRRLGDTERRLLNRMMEMVLRTLCPLLGYNLEDWRAHWADQDDRLPEECCWAELTVMGDQWQATLNLGWPIALERVTESAPQRDANVIRQQIAAGLRTVRTQLTVEVGAVEIPVGQIEHLKPGDILPLHLASETIARTQDAECLIGTICENGDQLAFRVIRHLGASND